MAETPKTENEANRVLVAVQDLFFVAKIAAAAQRLGVPLEFVREEQEWFQKTEGLPGLLPPLLIVDLNNASPDPIPMIAKLKADPLRKQVRIIGFLSHIQQDLKRKADQAGCDLVLPRSVFSKNMDELLRQRYGHL